MSRGEMLWGTAGLVALVAVGTPSAAQEKGSALLREGRYEEALAAFDTQLRGPGSADAAHGKAMTLRTLGRYAEAIAFVEERIKVQPTGLRTVLGELYADTGRYDEARRWLEEALSAGDLDRLRARLRLGELALASGEGERAQEHFDGLLDAYNAGHAQSADDLIAVGDACRRLGAEDSGLFRDALRAYDEATAADRGSIASRVALAELFLDKYNGTEARGEVQAALAINASDPAALLALARVENFEGRFTAMDRARKSLEINPAFVPARVFVAQLLLELEDFEGAVEEAEIAIETHPRSLDALSILAAARYLQGDDAGFSALEAQIAALNPRYA
ncbi:MAG: tetratricopeptide repeat protein, partial [Acidobacteriota bacterium]|nr:tetratricopeptide repeat protein [Acidobacteriota bacterium]